MMFPNTEYAGVITDILCILDHVGFLKIHACWMPSARKIYMHEIFEWLAMVLAGTSDAYFRSKLIP